MKRRDFLKTGLKIGVAANTLPMLLGGFPIRALGRSPLRNALQIASNTNNNVLVIIQLQGGNDGLNCVVPYTDSNYLTLRPTLGLYPKASQNPNTSNPQGGDLLPINDSLAFHWAMSGFSTLFGESKIALLQNVGYPNPILSHFRGTDVWNTATDSGIYASSGWVGRFLANQNPNFTAPALGSNNWPLAIEFGNALSDIFLAQNGGMGIAINSVPSKSQVDGLPTTYNYDAIPSPATTQYDELAFVRLVQSESNVYSKTIYNRTQQTNNATYPQGSTLGSQLSYIAQMIVSQINAGAVQTKIYLVTQGSYDTHSDELSRQSSLLGDLAASVLAFQTDLEQFGVVNGTNVADTVAMMTYSEFGRRAAENGSGTDHGTAAPHFVIGTQVKGAVYGTDPDLSSTGVGGINNNNENSPGNIAYDATYDFRNVYATVINEWLLAGTDQPTIDAAIADVLTQDTNAKYSDNTTPWNSSLGIFKSSTQSVASAPGTPGLMLLPNYPNPAYGPTTIPYVIDVAGPVELGIFSVDGTEVARPVDGWQSSGPQNVTFDAGKLPSGTYFYRLTTSSQSVTRPMAVVK